MIDKQPSKRSRPPTDMSRLSPEDRLAFERVAAILNKSLSELYDENPQHTSVGPRGTVVDPFQGGDPILAGPEPWLSTSHWQEMNGWQQDFTDKPTPQSNGPPAQSSGSVFEETEDSVYQWSEQTSQGPSTRVGGRENTPPASSENWFSVPTDFLTQAYHQDGITDNRTSLERPGVEPAAKDCVTPSRYDRSTSKGSPTQDRIAAYGYPFSPNAPDSDLEWVDLKASQDSGVGSHSTSFGDPATSEWSMIELANPQETFVLDKSNPKSVTWVPADSTGKELSPRKKRGPFQDPQLREQTSDTRKLKACVRCRMQKIRVSVHAFVPIDHLNLLI